MSRMIRRPYLLNPGRRLKCFDLKFIYCIAITVMVHGGYVHLSDGLRNRGFHIMPQSLAIGNISSTVAAGIIGERSVMNGKYKAQAVFIWPTFRVGRINRWKILIGC